MKILIIDASYAAHIGNGVLYQSSIYYLNKMFPKAEINVLANRKDSIDKIKLEVVNEHATLFVDEPPVGQGILKKIFWTFKTALFMGIQFINLSTLKISPSKLVLDNNKKKSLRLLEDSDLVVSITGEQINDSFRKTLPLYLGLHNMAIKMNKKMIYFPQSIGPLNKNWTKKMVKNTINKSLLAIGRDDYSMQELQKIGVEKDRYIFSPDIGVIQPYANRTESIDNLKKLGINISKEKMIGLTLSQIHFVEDGLINKDYLSILLDTIKKQINNNDTQILLMPANYNIDGSNSTDYETCKKFKDKLQDKYVVDILPKQIYSPYIFKGIQGCLSYVISTRMHAAILSTMAETPTITINTQRKLKGYMKNINMQTYSIDLGELTEELLTNRIMLINTNNLLVRKELKLQKAKLISELEAINYKLKDLCITESKYQ